MIYDARRGGQTKLIEPFNEGSDVSLVCEVSGGEWKAAARGDSHSAHSQVSPVRT